MPTNDRQASRPACLFRTENHEYEQGIIAMTFARTLSSLALASLIATTPAIADDTLSSLDRDDPVAAAFINLLAERQPTITAGASPAAADPLVERLAVSLYSSTDIADSANATNRHASIAAVAERLPHAANDAVGASFQRMLGHEPAAIVEVVDESERDPLLRPLRAAIYR